MFRDVLGRPSECPRKSGKSSCEKYFSTEFHHFCANYFTSSQNFAPAVLDTATTEWAHTLHEHLNTYTEPAKNT